MAGKLQSLALRTHARDLIHGPRASYIHSGVWKSVYRQKVGAMFRAVGTAGQATNRRGSRRRLVRGLAGLGITGVLWPLAGCERSEDAGSTKSPTPTRIRRLVVLAATQGDETARTASRQGFGATPPVVQWRRELAARGWVEGTNLTIDFRPMFDDLTGGVPPATDLLGEPPDIIITLDLRVALAASLATRTIPILMWAGVADPVGNGLAQSLGRPGGNVTGLAAAPFESNTAKMLQVFTEAAPVLRRVGIAWNTDVVGAWEPAGAGARRPDVARNATIARRQYEEAAIAIGIPIEPMAMRASVVETIEDSVAAAHAGGVDGVLLHTSMLQISHLFELATRYRLPVTSPNPTIDKSRALVAYWVYYEASGTRQLAEYTDLILRGTPPAELPILRPDRSELTVNLRVAASLGLTIPPSFLGRATEVIQ